MMWILGLLTGCAFVGAASLAVSAIADVQTIRVLRDMSREIAALPAYDPLVDTDGFHGLADHSNGKDVLSGTEDADTADFTVMAIGNAFADAIDVPRWHTLPPEWEPEESGGRHRRADV